MGFGTWLHYFTDVAQRRSTKLCTIFGRLPRWYTIYIHFRGLLPSNGISPFAKFTLRPSLAFSYIWSVTARHSSSGRQPNFAAFSRGCHLYSAGRPSRWAWADILLYCKYSLLTSHSDTEPVATVKDRISNNDY